MTNVMTRQKPKVDIIEPTVKKDEALENARVKKKRVAAYARVSTEQEEQQNSYEAQIGFYTSLIMSNPDWEFVEVYSDEGISGTSLKKREGFNRMIADAEAGKIDLILVKSISRFARNTVDSLSMVRRLKAVNVEVRFEKENVSSFDPGAELVFTVFSSIAQEESRSISDNVRWGHQRNMEQGKAHVAFSRFLGYKKGKNDEWEIVESEAKTIREIYDLFLKGKTINWIAKHLTAQGVKTPSGKDKWGTQTVNSILQNEKYKGDARLGKTYVEDFLTKKVKKNNGEKKQFYVHNHHPAIIEPEKFDRVQAELKRRSEHQRQISNNSPFTSRVICMDCGGFFGHKIQRDKQVWYCNHRYDKKDHTCETPIIPEEELKASFEAALGLELAQIATGKGPVALSPEQEVGRAALLYSARDKASSALQAGLQDFREEFQSTPTSDRDTFDVRYEAAMEKINLLKAALRKAEDDIIANAARKEKSRRFKEATENLQAETITYSDELFMATTEKILVSKVKNGSYTLTFMLTNGDKREVRKC